MAPLGADGSVGTAIEPESSARSLQPALRPKRRSKERNTSKNVPCSVEKAAISEENQNKGAWSFLSLDIQDLILSKLPYKNLFQAKAISKWFNNHINSDEFNGFRGAVHPQEGSLTALHFSGEHNRLWQCSGYDLTSKSWKKLPSFHMLPRLDPSALFKDHLICGVGGIMCANLSTQEKMVVFNPLTGRLKELPLLNHPRSPVLMHMILDSAGRSYKVVAAGSAKAGDEHLSKITEIYDSSSGIWTVAEELPGALFALNEHQTGIHRNGILYCIAFLEGDRQDVGKGVLAFSVGERRWLPHLSCPLLFPTNLNIVHLVDINGETAVFAEIEPNPYIRSVEHRIDILEDVVATSSGQGTGKWRNVMSETKVGSQAGLQVYPEYACVPFGEGKLCIFNTIVHTGIVFDVQSGKQIETLPSSPWKGSGETGFYSLNPLTFTFEPSFKSKP